MTDQIQLVRDLMTVGVATCAPAMPIVDIAHLLLTNDLESVVVLDQEGHAIGVVSHAELVAVYAAGEWQALTAEDIMRDGVPQLPPDIPLTTAAQIMQDQGLRTVYLMHHAGGIAYPAAVLSYTHLLRHLAARDEDDLADLGIKASRRAPLDAFIERRDAARRRRLSDREE
jgi:CBS domain-containing protein